jgi:hypothetical protein
MTHTSGFGATVCFDPGIDVCDYTSARCAIHVLYAVMDALVDSNIEHFIPAP